MRRRNHMEKVCRVGVYLSTLSHMGFAVLQPVLLSVGRSVGVDLNNLFPSHYMFAMNE